ncbi:hypothetical protein BT96DRAFT_941650 [Gymnopus androsaceus JB14]|uniref:Carboxylesterase type B domain-containing protein n=1 Tax=Gymnopus androsaceus JB14 TaxID=1447944 RepID=A0A6A4HFM2_9AGAR|nr:hypothetical protein BT96DRAFT_941650 [Gymnopus androsaceus JB14]
MSPFPQLRSYHTSEVPMVFGTYNPSSESAFVIENGIQAPSTSTETALLKTLQSAWVAFAQDPQNGLPSLGWSFTESAVIDALCPEISSFENISTSIKSSS